MSKVDFKETIAICVELALQSETRFKSTLSLGKQLSEKLHACMGDVDESVMKYFGFNQLVHVLLVPIELQSDKSIAADGNDFVKETNADQVKMSPHSWALKACKMLFSLMDPFKNFFKLYVLSIC